MVVTLRNIILKKTKAFTSTTKQPLAAVRLNNRQGIVIMKQRSCRKLQKTVQNRTKIAFFSRFFAFFQRDIKKPREKVRFFDVLTAHRCAVIECNIPSFPGLLLG
jgi:hypothetical protein